MSSSLLSTAPPVGRTSSRSGSFYPLLSHPTSSSHMLPLQSTHSSLDTPSFPSQYHWEQKIDYNNLKPVHCCLHQHLNLKVLKLSSWYKNSFINPAFVTALQEDPSFKLIKKMGGLRAFASSSLLKNDAFEKNGTSFQTEDSVHWTSSNRTNQPRVSGKDGSYNCNLRCPSQPTLFGRSVTFMRKSHRLCIECERIPTLQNRSAPNIV